MNQDRLLTRQILIVLAWAAAPGIACAYIDPGNGAYMVQALFTVVGAALFYLRHPIRSARAMLDWLASRGKANSAENAGLEPEHRSDE